MKTTYWILTVWWAHNKEVIDESLMRRIVTKMGSGYGVWWSTPEWARVRNHKLFSLQGQEKDGLQELREQPWLWERAAQQKHSFLIWKLPRLREGTGGTNALSSFCRGSWGPNPLKTRGQRSEGWCSWRGFRSWSTERVEQGERITSTTLQALSYFILAMT